MRLWRFQKCYFCGNELKNFRQVVPHSGTGWKLHLECERKIEQLKYGKTRYNYDGAMYRQMYYINIFLNIPNNREILVYQ